MSIASELNNLEGNIEDSYDAVNDMGGIIPAQRNMDNLDQAIRTIPQNQGTTYTAGTGIDITNDVISIDDTVVAELSDLPGVMTGASSSTAGTSGLAPAPAAGDDTKYLKGDGTWGTIDTGASIVTFYTQSDFGTSSPTYGTWYKDSSFTTAATGQDVLDAFNSGEVILEKWSTGSLSKLQTAFVVTRHTVAAGGGGATYHDFEISFLSTVPPYTVYCIYEDLTGTTVKMKKTALQAELTAGSNISISSNTISASVPTVNDATLTIQHNGTNVQTFTANQSTNATANIETIWADTITPTTAVATIGTTQIADGAVTASKIDFSSFQATSYVATLNSTYITSGTARWVKIGRLVLLNISDWTITANIPSNSTTLAISNLPKATEYSTYGHYVINGPSRKIRLGFNADRTSMNFFWASGAAATELCGQIIYISED